MHRHKIGSCNNHSIPTEMRTDSWSVPLTAMPKANSTSSFHGLWRAWLRCLLLSSPFHDEVELYLIMLSMTMSTRYHIPLTRAVSTSVFFSRVSSLLLIHSELTCLPSCWFNVHSPSRSVLPQEPSLLIGLGGVYSVCPKCALKQVLLEWVGKLVLSSTLPPVD